MSTARVAAPARVEVDPAVHSAVEPVATEHGFASAPILQKKCDSCAGEDDTRSRHEFSKIRVLQKKSTDDGDAGAAGPLIVSDEATATAPGQMRKSEFLAALRARICTTVDETLRGLGRSTEGCPYIDYWMSHFEKQDAAHVEKAVRRYGSKANKAKTAEEYVEAVTERAREAAERWATTGEVPELPGGAMDLGFGGGLLDMIGRALFKSENTTNERAYASFGGGRALDPSVRAPMETAFGRSFGSVRVHTDHQAAEWSKSMHARALTVGRHIAFAPGEYRPHTPEGDALIAHELAHVMQQERAIAIDDAAGDHRLEEDADSAAAAAVLSIWTGQRPRDRPSPQLKSSLRLSRCSDPRDTPLSGKEADTMIGKQFKDELLRRKQNADLGQGRDIKVVEDKEFDKEYMANDAWLIANKGKKEPSTPGGTVAFVDDRPTDAQGNALPKLRIWIRKRSNNAITVLHEVIHLYMHPNLEGDNCFGRLKEGLTEYFAKQIAKKEDLKLQPSGYDDIVEGLRTVMDPLGGDALFRTLYFEGDWKPLEQEVNKRTKNNFAFFRCELVYASGFINNPEMYARIKKLLTDFDPTMVAGFCAGKERQERCSVTSPPAPAAPPETQPQP